MAVVPFPSFQSAVGFNRFPEKRNDPMESLWFVQICVLYLHCPRIYRFYRTLVVLYYLQQALIEAQHVLEDPHQDERERVQREDARGRQDALRPGQRHEAHQHLDKEDGDRLGAERPREACVCWVWIV